MESISPLIRHMKRFVPLSDNDVQIIERSCQLKKIGKKEHLLEEGDVCNEKYFLVKGCLRKYINTENGDKQIFQFSIEDWWMTDYTSLESGKPSTCNIQA